MCAIILVSVPDFVINLKNQRLLIIAPHPDDEVIGCGGLIQKIKQGGGQVFILFLTIGDTRDFSKKGFSTLDERKYEIGKVSKFLKYDDYDIALEGNEFHLKLDLLGQKELMDKIERESSVAIEKIKPTIIAFPSNTSYNQDHQIAARAAHASLRTSSSHKHFIETVLSYESPADFWSLNDKLTRNFFVPLTKIEFENKLAALALYSSQARSFPSSRSKEAILALAKFRGVECISEFAESFTIFRQVFK